jgi:hypothetical protein
VDDSRHGLLHWLYNYIAERTGVVIYRLPQRWPVNLRETRGGRRRRRLLARKLSGFHRGSTPAITGHAGSDSLRHGLVL